MNETHPPSTRPARFDVWLELGLAGLAVVVLTSVTLGTRGVPQLGLALAAILLAVRAVRARRSERPRPRWHPGTWLCRLRVADLVPALVFLALVAVLHADGGRVEVDGPLLYMQARSLVIDHDLDYANEFAEFVPPQLQFIAEEARARGRSPDARAEPGPALLWLPFFLFAHGLTLALRAAGATVSADGYGPIYQNAVALGNLAWVFVGVVLAVRLCSRFFPRGVAATCAAGAWLATPLLWYSVYEPLMPHATATAAAAFFLWQWLRVSDRPERPGRWLALACGGGLLLSIQRYDAYFFLAPALTLPGLLLARARGSDRAELKRLALPIAAAALVFAVISLPVIVVGLATNVFGFTLQNWPHPYVQELLFSSRNGLFAWTPAAALGVLGLILFARRRPGPGLALLLTLAFGTYLLAASYGWHAAWSFGSRRQTEAFPIIVLGLCASAAFLLARPVVLGSLALASLVTWNLLLTSQVRRGEIPRDATFSFARAAQRAVRRVYETVGHPPSFPATLAFAHRYGVSPDRLDLLLGREPPPEQVVQMGADGDAPFIGRGWSYAEHPLDRPSFRWSEGGDSTLLVVLGAPHDCRLAASCAAAPHPRQLPQQLTVEVNGHPAGSWVFTQSVAERTLLVPARLWVRGINEVRLVYAWTVEESAVAGRPGSRQIALRAEYFRLTPVGRPGSPR